MKIMKRLRLIKLVKSMEGLLKYQDEGSNMLANLEWQMLL